MKLVVKHRLNVVNRPRKSRSLISKTIPNQAPELRFIIAQIQNGQAVNVLEMRADKEPSLDDIDMRFVSAKMNTSESLDAMLQDIKNQSSTLEGLGDSEESPLTGQGAAAGRQTNSEKEINPVE